jgi:GTP-binding protein
MGVNYFPNNHIAQRTFLSKKKDVPGLIAGAAQGVGLGHAFLRHVERCHVILHLVDATSNDPVADFAMLNSEITRFGSGQLAQMPQVVVVN